MYGAPWVTSYDRTLIVEGRAPGIASHRALFSNTLAAGFRLMFQDRDHGLGPQRPARPVAVAGLLPLALRNAEARRGAGDRARRLRRRLHPLSLLQRALLLRLAGAADRPAGGAHRRRRPLVTGRGPGGPRGRAARRRVRAPAAAGPGLGRAGGAARRGAGGPVRHRAQLWARATRGRREGAAQRLPLRLLQHDPPGVEVFPAGSQSRTNTRGSRSSRISAGSTASTGGPS